MSLLWNIFDEHKHLLESKGYDEKSLNSPLREGWLIEQLQINLSQSVKDAHNFQETTCFDLRPIGFFNNDAEVVLFELHYEYNPNDLQLYLKSLQASLDNNIIDLDFSNNNDVPAATKIYEYLANAEKLNRAREIANRLPGSKRNNQQTKKI